MPLNGQYLYSDKLFDGFFLPRVDKSLQYGIKTRIVAPLRESPPISDSIARGLAQRFDYLQKAVQVMAYLNKIEFARSSAEASVIGVRLPNLDDDWGTLYDCARLTGESNDFYRRRLQTRLKVLASSGTIPACQEIIDHLIDCPGGTVIESIYPAQAIVSFRTIDAMRAAKNNIDLVNNVLPDMFAGGVDYKLLIPFVEYGVKMAVVGVPQMDYAIRSALSTIREMTYAINAIVFQLFELPLAINAAIQSDITLSQPIKAALRIDRSLSHEIRSAIRSDLTSEYEVHSAIKTDRSLSLGMKAALTAECSLSLGIKAALSREFDMMYSIKAYCVLFGELPYGIYAAIRHDPQLAYGIHARIVPTQEVI